MGYANVDNKEQFFFLQLIDKNKRGVSKKLMTRNDSLLLAKDNFIFNGKLYSPGDGILKLGYVEEYSNEKRIKEIAGIKPEFISKAELTKIILAIKKSIRNSPKDDVLNEIYTELYFFYGKPDKQLIERLYNNKM